MDAEGWPSMQSRHVLLTYDDYAALPDDGQRYELHEGELSMTPAPGPGHQRISASLIDLLRPHVRSRGLGEVLYAPLDCILSPTTVVQPDIIFLDPSRSALVSARGVEGPPTLAIEIISPSSRLLDRITKHQLFERHGVPYYWIVDPDARTLEVYQLFDNGYALVKRATGPEPVALPPFPDLAFVPDSIFLGA
jgi:Uma2 family endonuclease